MGHYQSANLEYIIYCACDPWYIHQNGNVQHQEEEYVYMHNLVAYLWIRQHECPHCYRVAQMAFRAVMASVPVSVVWVGLAEIRQCLCASRVSAESLLCNLCKRSSHPFNVFWSIAGCPTIAAFTFLSKGNSTAHFYSSWTLAPGFLIRSCLSSIAVRKNSPLAILAIF